MSCKKKFRNQAIWLASRWWETIIIKKESFCSNLTSNTFSSLNYFLLHKPAYLLTEELVSKYFLFKVRASFLHGRNFLVTKLR